MIRVDQHSDPCCGEGLLSLYHKRANTLGLVEL
jgi:hypothetical protein